MKKTLIIIYKLFIEFDSFSHNKLQLVQTNRKVNIQDIAPAIFTILRISNHTGCIGNPLLQLTK
tara:strand:- start:4871 stop:5062 length:192 start_codon:yes stop_codon:yes gene_type:complete